MKKQIIHVVWQLLVRNFNELHARVHARHCNVCQPTNIDIRVFVGLPQALIF